MLLYGFLIGEVGLRAALVVFAVGNAALATFAIANRAARPLERTEAPA